jgi:hypothetical protein
MTIMTNNIFFDAAHSEFATANEKEGKIADVRKDLNPEGNKLFTIAHLAVVARSLGLHEKGGTGRKAIAGSFRQMITDNFGTKEAKTKFLAEKAIKFARHAEFGNAVEAADRHGNVGNFTQEISATFDALEITTQTRLVALLEPKEERTPAQELAIAALKAAGAKGIVKDDAVEGGKKGDIKITSKRVSTGTVMDDDAAQVLLDAVALILPGAADVTAGLVDAVNRAALDKAA